MPDHTGKATPDTRTSKKGIPYKWVALSNTTIATFMPSLASTFIIGAILSLIAAAMCAKGGEKYVHGVHGPGSEGSPRETDPQQVSGERTQ